YLAFVLVAVVWVFLYRMPSGAHLRATGEWNYEQIEAYLKSWNSRNSESLREQYYLGQLRYHQQQKKHALPPNCSNKAYMAGMGVCKPDSFCGARGDPLSQEFVAKIKNPVNYALKKQRLASLTNRPKKRE
ncbi:MAG: hypothetical protein QXF14_00390, partial [Candidatus Woesearchaeota archaeon]